MKLQEYLEQYLPYFRSFNFDTNLNPMVIVLLPRKWVIEHVINNKVAIIKVNENATSNEITFSTNDNAPIDVIFEHIKNIVTYNEEQEKRVSLFQEKMKELETFVKSASLEDIEKLQISPEKSTISNSSEIAGEKKPEE